MFWGEQIHQWWIPGETIEVKLTPFWLLFCVLVARPIGWSSRMFCLCLGNLAWCTKLLWVTVVSTFFIRRRRNEGKGSCGWVHQAPLLLLLQWKLNELHVQAEIWTKCFTNHHWWNTYTHSSYLFLSLLWLCILCPFVCFCKDQVTNVSLNVAWLWVKEEKGYLLHYQRFLRAWVHYQHPCSTHV